jgi:hypothetical protein
MNSHSLRVLRPWAVALVLAGAAGVVSPAAAQRGAVVRGVVRTADSTQAPVADALVLDRSGAPVARTDSLGRYRLAGVPAGVRTILVRRAG